MNDVAGFRDLALSESCVQNHVDALLNGSDPDRVALKLPTYMPTTAPAVDWHGWNTMVATVADICPVPYKSKSAPLCTMGEHYWALGKRVSIKGVVFNTNDGRQAWPNEGKPRVRQSTYRKLAQWNTENARAENEFNRAVTVIRNQHNAMVTERLMATAVLLRDSGFGPMMVVHSAEHHVVFWPQNNVWDVYTNSDYVRFVLPELNK